MIKVLVVDDHAVVRRGLEQLIDTAGDMELVGIAVNGDEAVELAGTLHPDVVLMDLSMPGLDGVQATGHIVMANPDIHVVVLTSFGDRERILAAIDAGAVGYLLKHAEPDHILNGIRAAMEGGSPLDPQAARVLLTAGGRGPARGALTDREREVLVLVRGGLANKQIARRLGITERTVKAHLTHVYQRIGVTDRTQAALWAQQHLP